MKTAWFMFGYFVIVVGRPHELIPGLSSVPFAKLAFAGALIAALSNKSALTVRLGALPIARTGMWLFAVAICSFFFSIWPGNTFHAITGGVVSLVASFIIVIKVSTNWNAVRTIVSSLPVIAALLALSTFLTTAGGRPEGTSYYDPNDLAFALVALFPVVIALAVSAGGARRLMLWTLAFAMVAMILITQSRGGLIGLAVVVLGMTVVSLQPKPDEAGFGKKLGSMLVKLLAVGLIAAVAWKFLPYEARERLSTVFSLEEDYNMTESAGRMSIWRRNVAATLTRPIGFGLSSFAAVDLRTGGKFKAAHNSLVEVLVELGFFGLFLYLRMFYLSWRALGKASRTPSPDQCTPAELERISLSRALFLSLAGIFVCSFFLSEAFTNLMWMIFSIVTAITVVNYPAATAAKSSRVPRGRLRKRTPGTS